MSFRKVFLVLSGEYLKVIFTRDAIGRRYFFFSTDQEMSQTLHCTNGYKAQYRKDLIPDAMKKAAIPMAMKKGFITGLDQEPSFGLFATGPDFNTKNGAVVVFACLNPK